MKRSKKQRKTAKRKNKRKARNRTQRPREGGLVSMVTSIDGTPIDTCSCPICMDMARRGIQVVNENGDPIDVPDVEPIEVRVRGTVSTWPELDTEWRTMELPAGCVLMDMLEYMRFNPDVCAAFPPGGLTASVNGDPGEPRQVLMPGDSVIVSGERDAQWSAMMSELLVPMPAQA